MALPLQKKTFSNTAIFREICTFLAFCLGEIRKIWKKGCLTSRKVKQSCIAFWRIKRRILKIGYLIWSLFWTKIKLQTDRISCFKVSLVLPTSLFFYEEETKGNQTYSFTRNGYEITDNNLSLTSLLHKH